MQNQAEDQRGTSQSECLLSAHESPRATLARSDRPQERKTRQSGSDTNF